MKRSDLEGLELSKEQVDAIMKLHGEDIEANKGKLKIAEDAAANIQKQLDEANQAIEGFKKLDPDGIKKASEEWEQKAKTFQSEAEQARKDADKKVLDYKFDTRLMAELKDKFKVINPKRIIQDLDKSLLKYDEEKDEITGNLADQVAPIREKEGNLFSDEKPPAKITTGVKTTSIGEPSLASAIGDALGIKK
jgi:Asp-tRNA(Asn)/Glu-tRNA(Gln) amidotransferase C subunit